VEATPHLLILVGDQTAEGSPELQILVVAVAVAGILVVELLKAATEVLALSLSDTNISQ
jgi:hypothetical protein